MEPVSVILGFACMGAIVFALHSEDRDALTLALLLTLVWGAAYIAWWCDQLRYLPILDLLVGAYAEKRRRVRHKRWLAVVHLMAVSSLMLNCAYDFYGPDSIVPYGHALNLAFFIQLVAVSSPGAGNVLTVFVRRVRNLVRVASTGLVKEEIGHE